MVSERRRKTGFRVLIGEICGDHMASQLESRVGMQPQQ